MASSTCRIVALSLALASAIVMEKPRTEEEKEANLQQRILNTLPAGRVGMPIFDVLKQDDLTVCGCDKCGTTSLYDLLYKATFGEDYGAPLEPPWVQDLHTYRWRNHWQRIRGRAAFLRVKHRVAIVRDPQERLFSAWKSKLACDSVVGDGMANSTDREKFLPKLYEVARLKKPYPYCISFERFVEVMKIIKDNEDLWKLQGHFLPQQFGCFRKTPVDDWTLAAPISDPRIIEYLTEVMGASANITMPHDHGSPHLHYKISERIQELLDEVTDAEYEALGASLRGHRRKLRSLPEHQ